MPHNRFSFGLLSLKPEDWRIFEQLSGQYLTIEDPDFRTTASSSGDGGRDSELIYQSNNPRVLAQFSVEKNWKSKLQETIKKINKNFPETRVLYYLTNQEVGARADEIKIEAMTKFGFYIDIRDLNWFLERQSINSAYENSAEIFCKKIVDPILIEQKVAQDRSRHPASSEELESAYYFITLENESMQGDKNLTDITFEGIVRSILRDTSNENKMHKNEIFKKAICLFPEHSSVPLIEKVNAALERLKKREVIRVTKGEGTYCLSTDGAREQLEKRGIDDAIRNEISEAIISVFSSIIGTKYILESEEKVKVISIVENAIQSIAVDRGWRFASAIACGEMIPISEGEYAISVSKAIDGYAIAGIKKSILTISIIKTIAAILSSTSPQIQTFLKSISISHTLLFLTRQTHDSQKVIQDLFLSGKIWLDTNIILPLLAETLFDEQERPFSEIILNAKNNNIELYLTSGVVEEIDRHISRSIFCYSNNLGQWEGEIPFLLKRYIESGASIKEFTSWTYTFRGTNRPIDDIVEFLVSKFSINRKEHSENSRLLTENTVNIIKEAWNTSHLKSRFRKRYIDDITALRLAKHDIENFIGIMIRREAEPPGQSHQNWWLTLDRNAFRIFSMIKPYLENVSQVSPIMSIDFLTNYLIIGPNRRFTNQNAINIYPHFVEMARNSYFSDEIINISNRIRSEMNGYEDRVIRRKVRDAIDEFKSKISQENGPVRVIERLGDNVPDI